MTTETKIRPSTIAIIGLAILAVLLIAMFRKDERKTGAPPVAESRSSPKQRGEVVRRDRIPVNTICYLGPAGVFDTNDDIATYEVAFRTGDSLAANNMLSDEFHFWLREKASVKVLYHGPYKGYVAPDAPQSTRDALSQFQICQIQILDGVYRSKVGWVFDTDLRCPTNKGR